MWAIFDFQGSSKCHSLNLSNDEEEMLLIMGLPLSSGVYLGYFLGELKYVNKETYESSYYREKKAGRIETGWHWDSDGHRLEVVEIDLDVDAILTRIRTQVSEILSQPGIWILTGESNRDYRKHMYD